MVYTLVKFSRYIFEYTNCLIVKYVLKLYIFANFVNICVFDFCMLLLLLATSPWGLSKLWGGGVPTSYFDHYWPRLCHLFLLRLPIVPVPPSSPAVRCLASPAVVFCPDSARDHPPTQASPVSVPAYRKTFARISLTRHFQRPTPPLLPHPHHTWRIPVNPSLTLPPYFLLTWLSAVVPQPPVATTDI